MKKYSARYVFPVNSPPIRNGLVEVDDNKNIIALRESNDKDNDVELLDGIIIPGLINTHCHLELSYLKNKIAPNKGMVGFIKELILQRHSENSEQIQQSIAEAENEMLQNGIVAVGDIANTIHTLEQKKKQHLYYHTFIELFDLNEEKTEIVFKKGLELKKMFGNDKCSVVAHSPYTVTPELMKNIDTLKENISSIHHQESSAERELFENKSGSLFAFLNESGASLKSIKEYPDSISYISANLSNTASLILVHNTYSNREELKTVVNIKANTFLCTCPNANLFIENTLPDYNSWIASGLTICIGTDSYASNSSLSVLDELITLQHFYPDISFEILLQWATINGAIALGVDKWCGSIEPGKKCGLNLIKGINVEHPILSKNCSIIPLY